MHARIAPTPSAVQVDSSTVFTFACESADSGLVRLQTADGCATSCGSRDGKEYCCCPTGTDCKMKIRTCERPATGGTESSTFTYFR